MRVALFSVIGLLLCVCGPVFAQGKPRPELAIVLEPEQMVDGVPQAWTFVLTNVSGHELRLPQPSIDCSNPTATGSVWMNESWTLGDGTGLGKGGGACDGGGTGLPPVPVVERARGWRVLRPGDHLYVKAERQSLHYGSATSGVYCFSAMCLPPSLSEEERQQLKAAGIAVPERRSESGSLTFRK